MNGVEKPVVDDSYFGYDAIIVLGEDGRLLKINGSAREMLRRGQLMQQSGPDNLEWTDVGAQRAVAAAIRDTIVEGIGRNVAVKDDGDLVHRLRIDILPDASRPWIGRVLLSVRDLRRLMDDHLRASVQAFRFTPSEAALAKSLLAGLSLEQHAALRGSAIDTVRKQLASMFQKSGTGRQAALVSAIISLPTVNLVGGMISTWQDLWT